MNILNMRPIQIGNLNISVPIIQGGMGVGISLSGLAAAVANQGGVGVIASAGLGLIYRRKNSNFVQDSIQGLRREIQKFRMKSKGILGVNIMVAMSNFADMVKTSISEKADIIFSGAGLPLDLPGFLKSDSVTKLVPIVSSGRAAKIICLKWQQNYNYLPDAVVVEGPKAGGHLGFKTAQINDPNYSLEHILPDVVSVVKEFEIKSGKTIPVIAAGGIYFGQDILNMQKLGAAGVQMGTRFVTTEECDASESFKNSYLKSKKEDMEIIISPVGMPGRAIHNKFIEKLKQGKKHPVKCPFKCLRSCDITTTPYCIMNALFSAFKGNFNSGYAFAGANAYLAEKIISVQETFQNIRKEYLNSK